MTEKGDFLAIPDFSTEELHDVLRLAHRLKGGTDRSRPLEGQTLAMIFEKSSTRTRVSFEVGMYQLGGHALFLSSRDIQLGRGEPIEDTARVLSRYVDGIMIRTFAQQTVVDLAEHGSVPVINGLTDLVHPCQVMADVMTMQEAFGEEIEGRKVAWIGDGNNMANSWLNAAYRLGLEVRIACPAGYDPDAEIFERAKGSSKVAITRDPVEAAEGADVVTTDVWASMGQEEEAQERMRAFEGFQVNAGVMEAAAEGSIFLHCLPAHRGEEVTAEVFEGARSRVFDEAENRLHVQKAIMIRLMGGGR
ncbi:MAG: ornithine carbamoyltransferase [Gemmatimonadetes bacterium]|nr:ornithine carbamoyltransferase [Gemmatimonadota bacterium]